MNKIVNIIGGGLAGCEATYQLSKRGISVRLYEQKPLKFSPAHSNQNLAEIVCSNSLKSTDYSTASGALKAELELLDCMLLKIAKSVSVPAGSALAVDREKFAEAVTKQIEALPNVEIIHEEVESIDPSEITIVATGPLTAGKLFESLSSLLGEGSNLYFFDASAPIVAGESVDYTKTFSSGRYGKGESDYINCPINREEYYAFVQALTSAQRVELKEFENVNVFEGCMPIEIMASRGEDTLRYGPLRPVGLVDNDGKRPFAVVQLRRENTSADMFNLVGFQTNLLYGEQKRVFSLIPALHNAEFVKYGVMHRNTYICAPKYLNADFSLKTAPNVFVAGQLSGVEGYVESIASGLVAAIGVANRLQGKPMLKFSENTIIGALIKYLTTAEANGFQPMNANFGILPPLEDPSRDKHQRKLQYTARAIAAVPPLA